MNPNEDHSMQIDDERGSPNGRAGCYCADWLTVGESRILELAQGRVTIRYVGAKGRRIRIAIEAPAGTAFT